MDRRADFESIKASSHSETEAVFDCSGFNYPGHSPKRCCPSRPRIDQWEQHTLGEAIINIEWKRDPNDVDLASLLLELIGEAELEGILYEKAGI